MAGVKRVPAGAVLMVAVFLAGLNMRPLLTSVSALLLDLQSALGLSATLAGSLVALPTLFFGIFSMVTPLLLRFMDVRAVIVSSMLLLALGSALRATLGSAGLFAGMFIASVGISFVAVLAPAVAKQAFPQRIGFVMGAYTTSFCLGASMGAGLTAPMAHWFGGDWRLGLAAWAAPALLGALWWLGTRSVALSDRPEAVGAAPSIPARALWRDPLAWQVTLFMGLQSGLGQSLVGWMPVMLIDRGLSAVPAGMALSGTLLAQLLPNLVVPWMAARARDQRALAGLIVAFYVVGTLGLLYAPVASLWLWVVLCGLGMGGAFSMGLSFVVLRTRTSAHATALSSMSQGVGYTIAAAGPFLVGLLYDGSGGWHSTALLFGAIGLIVLWAALMAGRDRYVLSGRPA